MKKTFNVVMLPSKEQTYQVKEGDLFINYPPYDWGKLEYLKCERVTTMGHAWNGKGIQTYINNLYITSDDKIKEGDWYYDTNHNAIGKYDSSAQIGKKIVATTDKSIMHLSNNGRVGYPLPNIHESFIQDYIKAYNEGNPITEVELEVDEDLTYNGLAQYTVINNPLKIKTNSDNTVIVHQSKMYSEDDIYMAIDFGRSHSSMTDKQFIESLNK